MNGCVCLFTKAPNAGAAKTRLAPALGDKAAAQLANAMLQDALDCWELSRWPVQVQTTGEFDDELRERLTLLDTFPQAEGDLGERMEVALRRGLAAHGWAVAVGTDSPAMEPSLLEDVEHLLERHDAVIGPAADGGFYLLALSRCPEGLLNGIAWSHPETCQQTIKRLEQHGFSVAQLQTTFDVDTPSDLARLSRHLIDSPRGLRRTREFCKSNANRSISVIIPVLNESERIPALIESLQAEHAFAEIIVVDGGSTDDSKALAAGYEGVVVLDSRPGRAMQMNRGADEASGNVLLFLHADAQLPEDAVTQIHEALDSPDFVAGAFRLQTVYDVAARSRRWVEPFLRLADLRSRYTRFPYGDQALFLPARTFRVLGGYPGVPLFEDLAITQRLRRLGDLTIAPGPVRVSGRRFQERPFYYLALMNSFPLLYRLGVPTQQMARLYPQV